MLGLRKNKRHQQQKKHHRFQNYTLHLALQNNIARPIQSNQATHKGIQVFCSVWKTVSASQSLTKPLENPNHIFLKCSNLRHTGVPLPLQDQILQCSLAYRCTSFYEDISWERSEQHWQQAPTAGKAFGHSACLESERPVFIAYS